MGFDPKFHNLDIEKLQLLDMSSEDDYLIDYPFRDSLEDLRLSVTFEKTNPRDVFKRFGNTDNESEGHQKRDHMISEFAEPKRPSFLRRSLAWDSEFFTSEGVLDPEELFVINKGFKRAEVPQLPRIRENVRCKSADSKSTLNASMKVISRSQSKLKSVSASKSESIKQEAIINRKMSKESIMSSPKPPKRLSPAYQISAKQRERAPLASDSVPMDHKARKTRSGPDLKIAKKSRLGDLSIPISSFTPPRKSDSSVSFTEDSTDRFPSYDSVTGASSSRNFVKCTTKNGISSRNVRSVDGWPTESPSSASFASKRPTPSRVTATRAGSYLVYNVIKSSDLEFQEIEKGQSTSQCTTRTSIESKRTGKYSGLRKPSPKLGFFDEGKSMQPVESEKVIFHIGEHLPNISGRTSEKRATRFQPAKTLPDTDVSPAMERESSSKAKKTSSASALMGGKLRREVLSRNKMSIDRKREKDNTRSLKSGPTNSFPKKQDDAISNIVRNKASQKENICNYEDQVNGLSRFLEGVDLNRDVVIEQTSGPRTPLADKTCLSNRSGLFGLSVESPSDMVLEKSVLYVQEGAQKEYI